MGSSAPEMEQDRMDLRPATTTSTLHQHHQSRSRQTFSRFQIGIGNSINPVIIESKSIVKKREVNVLTECMLEVVEVVWCVLGAGWLPLSSSPLSPVQHESPPREVLLSLPPSLTSNINNINDKN